MGEVVDLRTRASARDRRLVLEILRSAQLAQAYASYGRAAFLASPEDRRRIAERLRAIASAARSVTRALRERAPDVPWAELAEAGDLAGVEHDPAQAWVVVKKVVPRAVRGLAPLVGPGEDAVFLWAPDQPAKRSESRRKGARGRKAKPPA